MSTETKPDIDDRATPNSTSDPKYHSHKGIDVSISTPVHINNLSIGPTLGHTSLRYKSTTKSYNNFGVAQSDQVERHHFDSSYISLSLRYENQFFIEIVPRKFLRSGKTRTKVSVGIAIGF